MVPRIKGEIPNSITCMNLMCGCLAVIFSFEEGQIGSLQGYEWSFLFIGLAAVFDFCDGAMARLIHAYSLVGKELDSLSDLVSFGVAPAMLMFNTLKWAWAGSDPYWLLPYLAMMIAICGGIRLARFNVDTRQASEFIGLPIPANAIFWIGAVSWMHRCGNP
ncbi:MAG: CDP-diacylglycerol--serine O-phosphatidyltransferase, partial [Muribaculaceae bacterium]|nr:CDP-diacylglycerol--serine O-phosphatidyltransferase [Muribaculaceae bacterium]